MPYIKQEDRKIKNLIKLDKVGKLNFLLTLFCDEYLFRKGESYQAYNDIVGALECCKLEYYRKKTSNYEDKKIRENGDIN